MQADEPNPSQGDLIDSGKAAESLEHFIEVFDRHKIEYLIIGGQAEILMGGHRPTFDSDFCYRRTKENLDRLAVALRELKPSLRGAPPDLPFIIDARSLALGNNFTFVTPHGDLDLLAEVEPLGGYDRLAASAESFSFGDRVVRTIGLEDLIRVKEHIRREKDLASLRQLYSLRRERGRQ